MRLIDRNVEGERAPALIAFFFFLAILVGRARTRKKIDTTPTARSRAP